jgi:hypothetical protein
MDTQKIIEEMKKKYLGETMVLDPAFGKLRR